MIQSSLGSFKADEDLSDEEAKDLLIKEAIGSKKTKKRKKQMKREIKTAQRRKERKKQNQTI